MICEIRSFIHLKLAYFRQLWSLIEWAIIGCSWAGICVYIWRYHEFTRIGTFFQETNGYIYINLQLAAYINDVFTFLLSFCCFFGSIKFLHLCRFYRRVSLLTETIRHAGKDLLSFMSLFCIVFMAYVVLFYHLFASKIWACSNLLNTCQMLFEMMVLKFNLTELSEADGFLGPFCIALFIIFIVFICMNMFISIIIDKFRKVRHNFKQTIDEDHEIFVFMLRKFKRWTSKKMKSFLFKNISH
jgi:polycystin 1L2